MKKLSEGNLYNTEMEITNLSEPTKVGLESWKKEVKKQLLKSLYQRNIKDLNPILLQVFGDSLE
jgi:hypothetical protein